MNTIDIPREWEQVADRIKQYKIEMIRPQWIIALQAGDEMEHLLRGYGKMGWHVIRLTCSKQVVTRSQTERQKYRNERYKAYFKSAKVVDCSIHKVVLPYYHEHQKLNTVQRMLIRK